MESSFDTIIKERMLKNLKDSISKHWGCGEDGQKVLNELYLTDLKGICLPDEYIGEDLLREIGDKFYFYLSAIRDEFEPFIEIYVMPSYEDTTGFIMVLGDKVLIQDHIKPWNFWWATEELLAEEMYLIYRTLLSKMENTYECYTLLDADIQEVAVREGLSLDGIDLDDVVHYIKKGIECALDNRDEIIEEAIEMAGGSRFEKMECQ